MNPTVTTTAKINNNKVVEEIISFWFANEPKWFVKEKEFDELIKDKFLNIYELAMKGALIPWESTPYSMLALIIVLDQFPRNMYRKSPMAFSGDQKALSLAKKAIELEFDLKLDDLSQRKFLYMPFMHSESLADQERSVKLYSQVNDPSSFKYAQVHYDIIAKFGRFPHRNQVLGRISTHQEQEFLNNVHSGF